MLPIAPLMIEHRLIERMVELMKAKQSRNEANPMSGAFVRAVVDFLRSYADRVHHGKEEDILFAELVRARLSAEHRRAVDELTQDHRWAREKAGQMAAAAERWMSGDTAAALNVSDCMRQLAEFYPRHIEREDRHFFLPVTAYFDQEERERLLEAFREFDRQMIHEKYRGVVEVLERGESEKQRSRLRAVRPYPRLAEGAEAKRADGGYAGRAVSSPRPARARGTALRGSCGVHRRPREQEGEGSVSVHPF